MAMPVNVFDGPLLKGPEVLSAAPVCPNPFHLQEDYLTVTQQRWQAVLARMDETDPETFKVLDEHWQRLEMEYYTRMTAEHHRRMPASSQAYA